MRHRNADSRLRDIERRAAAGDRDALKIMFIEKVRAGKLGQITLDEISAAPTDVAARTLRDLPDGLGGPWWKANINTPRLPVLPPMTHDEIVAALAARDGTWWRRYYEDAITHQAEIHRSYQDMTTEESVALARQTLADEVADYLADPANELNPAAALSNFRAPIAWAVAKVLREAHAKRAQSTAQSVAGSHLMPRISPRLGNMFVAEVDREDAGFTATLGSALESIEETGADYDIIDELRLLIRARGPDVAIRDIYTDSDWVAYDPKNMQFWGPFGWGDCTAANVYTTRNAATLSILVAEHEHADGSAGQSASRVHLPDGSVWVQTRVMYDLPHDHDCSCHVCA